MQPDHHGFNSKISKFKENHSLCHRSSLEAIMSRHFLVWRDERKKNEKRTYHPKKETRIASCNGISHYFEALVRINNFHNGHGTHQEKHDLTHFSWGLSELRCCDVSWWCLPQLFLALYTQFLFSTTTRRLSGDSALSGEFLKSLERKQWRAQQRFRRFYPKTENHPERYCHQQCNTTLVEGQELLKHNAHISCCEYCHHCQVLKLATWHAQFKGWTWKAHWKIWSKPGWYIEETSKNIHCPIAIHIPDSLQPKNGW